MNRTTRVFRDYLYSSEDGKELLQHSFYCGFFSDYNRDFVYSSEDFETHLNRMAAALKREFLPNYEEYPDTDPETGETIKKDVVLGLNRAGEYSEVLADVLENELDYRELARPYLEQRKQEELKEINEDRKKYGWDPLSSEQVQSSEDECYQLESFHESIEDSANEFTIAYIDGILKEDSEGFKKVLSIAAGVEKEIWKEKTHDNYDGKYWGDERKNLLAERLKESAAAACKTSQDPEKAVCELALGQIDFKYAAGRFIRYYHRDIEKAANLPVNEYGEDVLSDGWAIYEDYSSSEYYDCGGLRFAYDPKDLNPDVNPHVEQTEKQDDSEYY